MAELSLTQRKFELEPRDDASGEVEGGVGQVEVLLEVGARGPAGLSNGEPPEVIDCGTF